MRSVDVQARADGNLGPLYLSLPAPQSRKEVLPKVQHDEFSDFLCAARGQIPPPSLQGSLHVLRDGRCLCEELVRPLTIRHSATISPGCQSGFRSQYQLPSGR